MRHAILGLILFSCAKPEKPRTTEFASQTYADQQIASICSDEAWTVDTVRGGTARESWGSHRTLCELALDRAKHKVIGELWIEMEGSATDLRGYCSLRLGPSRVDEPVSPTIIENFVESPVLKQHIEARLKEIDIKMEYSLQISVDGFQLDVVQHGIHIAGHQGVFVDFRLNGCAQLPDTMQEQFKQGASVI